LQGDIKGGITFSSKDGKNWESKGEIGAGLTVVVEGNVHAEGYVFKLQAAAGASIGAESGVEGKLVGKTKDGSPLIDGQLEFKGLTVYYACFYQIGFETSPPSGRIRKPKPGDRLSNKIEHKNESKSKYVWLQPAKWPEQSSGVSLNKGEV
jgi:hypothetical protein